MAEETLYFQNPRLLAELYCGDDKNLSLIEETLHIKLVSRDDWLQLRGEENAVEKTKLLFQSLEAAKKCGMRITPVDFRHALQEVLAGNGAELLKMFDKAIVLQFKRKSVIPKTFNQKKYLQSIQKHDVIFGIGPAGTGKTYLAVAAALDSLQNGEVERVILTRPAVEAGEALGFLPGDLTEKIQPYLLPLYDAIYDMLGRMDGRRLLGLDGDKREDKVQKVEIAPLAYMRGRTLSDAFVILDEAQNTTPEQMMMFLTRLGNGSRMVITGDKTQVDLPRHKYSGLKEAEKVLRRIPDVKFHYFEGRDVVRNPLVQKIIEAYAAYQQETGAHRPREVSPD